MWCHYWEAQEAWETLWHAHGRQGPTADVLKGLIKLAAAGVKVREHQPHGIRIHSRRAAELFELARVEGGGDRLGLDLAALSAAARTIAEHPPDDPTPAEAPAVPVLGLRIEPVS